MIHRTAPLQWRSDVMGATGVARSYENALIDACADFA